MTKSLQFQSDAGARIRNLLFAYLPPKFTSRTVHSRRHAAALSCRRLRFACTPGQEWPQNLDLYESCWLSLTILSATSLSGSR